MLTHNRNDVAAEVILDNMIRSSRQPAYDNDFINDVVDEDETLEDYVDDELSEEDSETDKESISDEQFKYYSETDDNWLYYLIDVLFFVISNCITLFYYLYT